MGKLENRTLDISMSSIKCFLTCRRKYCLRYVEGLEPLRKARPLSMGGAFHKGLEILWNGGDMTAAREAVAASYTPDQRIEAGFDPDLAETILCEYDARVHWKAWGIQKAERKFRINMGYGLWLNGYIDAVASCDSRGLLIETKLLSSIDDGYLNHLLWDDQAAIYLYAARRLGIEVSGIMYNIVQKPTIKPLRATPEGDRKFKKDGTLYANQRDRDETMAEYLERVKAWYADPERVPFVQHTVYRNEAQLKELEARVGMIAADIKAAYKDDSWYPNGGACAVMSCEYESLCLENTPEARAMFQIDKPKEEVPAIP